MVICTNRVTTRNFYLCKSRHVWKEFRLQSTVWAKYTTSDKRIPHGIPLSDRDLYDDAIDGGDQFFIRPECSTPERQVAEAELEWWCGWAARSRLSPFRKLAKTVRQHWDGILAYFDTHLTSAAIEAE